MTGRAVDPQLQGVERRLRSAAADAAWPEVPDLREAVLARITMTATGDATPGPRPVLARPDAGGRPDAGEPRGRPAPRRPRAPGGVPVRLPLRPPARRVPALRALALALLLLLALAGIAGALGFRLPGLEIERTDRTLGPAVTSPAGAPVDAAPLLIGSPVPFAEARDGEPPRVLVPAALEAPTTAFVAGPAGDRVVTLGWRAAAGGPTLAGTDLALVLTAAPGRIDEPLLGKVVGAGTTIQPVSVGGDRGWWIAGRAHELFIEGTGGPRLLATRLAGDTLVFERDGTVYRLESALGLEATLGLAASLR